MSHQSLDRPLDGPRSRAALGPTRVRTRTTGAAAVAVGVALVSLLVALVGVGALALLFAGVLTLLLLAPLAARAHLAGLALRPPRAGHASAGVSLRLPLVLENRSRRFVARDLLVSVDDGRVVVQPATAHLGGLAPGASRTVTTVPSFVRRGRIRTLRVTVASSFPLGLTEVLLDFELPCDLVVLPRLGRLGALERPLVRSAGAAQGAPRGTAGDGEFYGLREWREGESQRRVHWKLSARRGRLLLRELVDDDHPAVRLVLSTWVGKAVPSRPFPPFERAVALTATLVEHFLRRGQRLELVLAGPEPVRLEASGRAALLGLLTALAEVTHHSGAPQLAFELPASGARRAVPVYVLAGGGGRGGAPTEAWVLDVDDESGLEVFAGMRPERRGAPPPERGVARSPVRGAAR